MSNVINVNNSDGSQNELALFEKDKSAKRTFVILPGMGIRASYYKGFAAALSEKGNRAVTVDWRGFGKSSIRPSRKTDFGYKILVDDLKTVLTIVNQKFDNEVVILGHSLGGQIASLYLAKYPEAKHKLVLLTAASVYHKGWTGWMGAKVKFAGATFKPIAKLLGYFPGAIVGFGGTEAMGVIKDWTINVKQGIYQPAGDDFNYETGFKQRKVTALSISVKHDSWATFQAVKNLYSKFNKESKITHLEVDGEKEGLINLDHFNWAKQPDFFIPLIENWLNQH